MSPASVSVAHVCLVLRGRLIDRRPGGEGRAELLRFCTGRAMSGDLIGLLRRVLGTIKPACRLILRNSRRSHATIYATG